MSRHNSHRATSATGHRGSSASLATELRGFVDGLTSPETTKVIGQAAVATGLGLVAVGLGGPKFADEFLTPSLAQTDSHTPKDGFTFTEDAGSGDVGGIFTASAIAGVAALGFGTRQLVVARFPSNNQQ